VRLLYCLAAIFAASMLSGCAATKEEVAANLGQRYIGQNVDSLVRDFGPPTSQFRMNSGETSYVWQLSAVTSINVDSDRYGSSGTAQTNYCKVDVIASANGTVTQLKTEDRSGTGGLWGLMGVDVYGSICGQRLGMPRQQG
jgi:hypothetical protein